MEITHSNPWLAAMGYKPFAPNGAGGASQNRSPICGRRHVGLAMQPLDRAAVTSFSCAAAYVRFRTCAIACSGARIIQRRYAEWDAPHTTVENVCLGQMLVGIALRVRLSVSGLAVSPFT